MLKFDRSYYEEEVRSDYTVKPMVKRNWAALLEVLSEIDRVCKKYDITYFADWGTLLGAIRHKSFVPWDDDMDLAMKREDYEKFQEILPIEFKNFEADIEDQIDGKLYYYSPMKGEKNAAIQTIISNGNYINFEDAFLKRYHGYPFVAAVDVFPLDYFPEDTNETDLVYNVIKILEDITFADVNWDENQKPSDEEVIDGIKRIEELIGFHFDYTGKLRKQCLILMDSLSKMYSRDESKYLCSATWYSYHRERDQRYQKEWYDEAVYVPFENIEIPVPKEYDKVLTAMYKDYMTPRIYESHGDEQAKMLEEQFDFKGQDPMTVVLNQIKDYE